MSNEKTPGEIPHASPPSTLHATEVQDAIEAVEKTRSRFHIVSLVTLLILVWVLFQAPPGLATAVAVLTLFSAKKAFVEYRALVEKQRTLLASLEGA